jgi:hypothetical protein
MIHIKTWRMALPSLCDRGPKFVQARSQIMRRGTARGLVSSDGDIDRRQSMLIQAKRLTRDALDAIARNGRAECSRGDCQPQARISFMIGQDR